MADHKSLRLSPVLLFVGLLLFVGITALHPGGDAINHPAVFAEYAASPQWDPVHLGEFASMVVTISGLLALDFAFNTQQRTPGLVGWLAAILAVAALALYGVLQAVDAWVSAPEAEKAARFASAEAIRWLEEGVRSYQDVLPGLAIIFLAIMVVEAASSLQPIGYLMGLSGISYLAQGFVLSFEGFSGTETLTIIIAEILTIIWIIWLLVVAWRIKRPVIASTG